MLVTCPKCTEGVADGQLCTLGARYSNLELGVSPTNPDLSADLPFTKGDF